MRKGVSVHFACNNPDNGDFAGIAGMAAVSIGGETMDLELDFMGGVKFSEKDNLIRIHRQEFRFTGVTYWCGNWCWNAYRLPYVEYRRHRQARLTPPGGPQPGPPHRGNTATNRRLK